MTSNMLVNLGDRRVDFIETRFLWQLSKLTSIESDIWSPNFTDAKQNKWVMKRISFPLEFENSFGIELILLEFGGGLNSFTVAVQLREFSAPFNNFTILGSKRFTYKLGGIQSNTFTLTGRYGPHKDLFLQIFHADDGESFKPLPREHLSMAWKELLSDAKFSDVTIATSGKSFPAHKAVLSARSPVLSAMFSNECSESKENRVDFSAFSEAVVQGFIEFIYTDKTEILPEYTEEWLRIADMYKVDGLKTDAGIEISKTLTVENAIEVFRLAYLHSVEDLKPKIKDFMKRNSSAIGANKSGIQALVEIRPDLVAELFSTITG